MKTSPRRPDFFIVGAPKAGTTSLHAYLRAHPHVFMPVAKELHYFGSDLRFLRTDRLSESEYLGFFARVPETAIRVGEASVRYLMSRVAASEIAAFRPDAAIVVMLRNPVDAMLAMHGEYLFSGVEDVRDFRAALDAEQDRRVGKRIPPATNVVEDLLYRDAVQYADQIERYLRAFGERVHVVLFDDFAEDTSSAYEAVQRFLGLEYHAAELTIVNPRKEPRSRLVAKLMSNPPSGVRRLARIMERPTRKRLFRAVQSLNARAAPRRPIDRMLRARLVDELRPDIERLSRLIGRDLSRWLEV